MPAAFFYTILTWRCSKNEIQISPRSRRMRRARRSRDGALTRKNHQNAARRLGHAYQHAPDMRYSHKARP